MRKERIWLSLRKGKKNMGFRTWVSTLRYIVIMLICHYLYLFSKAIQNYGYGRVFFTWIYTTFSIYYKSLDLIVIKGILLKTSESLSHRLCTEEMKTNCGNLRSGRRDTSMDHWCYQKPMVIRSYFIYTYNFFMRQEHNYIRI